MVGFNQFGDRGVPERDASFSAMIRALSAPETGPAGDNFMTNEDSFVRVAGEIARRTPRDGVYLGVGPDQNFTYIAHAEPVAAFILDHRRRNLRLHLLHKALFSLSADRVAYLTLLTARQVPSLTKGYTARDLVAAFQASPMVRELLDATIAEVARALRPLGVLDDKEWADLATIQARLAGPGMTARFLAMPIYPTLGQLILTTDHDGHPAHVLSRDDLYQRMRQAQRDDRVIPVVGDFAAPDVLPRLGSWLRRRGLGVSLFYISDVEFFLFRSGKFASYVENLAQLPWLDHALIVRTSTREIAHPERVAGDSSTTIVRSVASFLDSSRADKIRSVDDLFAPTES
jgi:hypothetical protein